MSYKEQPFDLETALANPDWVYLEDGRKILEFAHLKLAGVIAATFAQLYLFEFFDETGKMQSNSLKPSHLILRIPTKKMKVTVFVWDDGSSESYTSEEMRHLNSNFEVHLQKAELGLCTKHEFEVEI